MASKNSTAHKLRTQPKLTTEEIKRIAEKLAVRIEHDSEETALLMLFLSHLETLVEQRDSYMDLWSALHDFRRSLFVGTTASANAQKEFQAEAYQNRGNLLLWPNERKGAK